MLTGLPSDERAERAELMWENATMRAEMHACRHALSQLRGRIGGVEELARAEGWQAGQQQSIAQLSMAAGCLERQEVRCLYVYSFM